MTNGHTSIFPVPASPCASITTISEPYLGLRANENFQLLLNQITESDELNKEGDTVVCLRVLRQRGRVYACLCILVGMKSLVSHLLCVTWPSRLKEEACDEPITYAN